MIRVAPLALALALSACSATPTLDYTVSVDPAFAPEEADAVMAGIADWQAAIPELHVSYVMSACDSPSPSEVCVHPAYDPPDPAHDVVGSTYTGSADNARVWIFVDRIRATGWDPTPLIRQTSAHEIGHAVGLRHSGEGTLMAADVPDQAHSVTAADVAQFWGVRGR